MLCKLVAFVFSLCIIRQVLAIVNVVVVLVDLVRAGHSLQFSIGDLDVLLAGLSLPTGAGMLGRVLAGLKSATTVGSGATAIVVLLLLFNERFHFQIQIFFTKYFKIKYRNFKIEIFYYD